MPIRVREITFSNVILTLTNQRALFWKEKRTLILSDLHLGKAAHFRKNGIPLPTQVTLHDLQRLERLIDVFAPQQVVIVGDLIHAGHNREVYLLRQLVSRLSHTKFILISGNHDRFEKKYGEEIGIHAIYSQWQLDGIFFIHQAEQPDRPTISGHLHPGVRIHMPTKKKLLLPCFVVTKKHIILPAFSLFTGLDTRTKSHGAIRYAFDADNIYTFS